MKDCMLLLDMLLQNKNMQHKLLTYPGLDI